MGSALVTLPDGRRAKVTFDSPDQLDAAVNDLTGHQQQAPQQPEAAPEQQAPAQPPDNRPVGDAADAVREPLLAFGSSAIAAPVAGLAGLGTLAGNAMGLTDREPADVVRGVQGALTYQPRTKAGQAVTNAAAYPFEKLAEGADWVGDKAMERGASPGVATAFNVAVQSLPALIGTKGAKVAGNGSRSASSVRSPVPAGEAAQVAETAATPKRAAGLESVSKPIPTIEELGTQAKAAYKRATDAGVKIAPASLNGLKAKINSTLVKDGLDKDLHPDTSAALRRINGTKGEITLDQLETLRKIASDAKGAQKAADKRMAGQLVDEIDDYVANMSEKDVTAGNVQQVTALKEARDLYSRKMKAQEINDLVERAKLSAPNFSASGMENALRTEFRALAKNKNRIRRFTPQEQAAIRKVAVGGPVENAFRFIGKFAPTGVVSGVLSGGAGAMIAGPMGVALPAAGLAGRAVATRMTMKNVNAAEEMMRRGPNFSTTKELAKRYQREPADF